MVQEKLGAQTRKPGIEIADEYLVKLEQLLRQSHDFPLGSYRESYLRPDGFLVLGKTEFLSEPYRSGYEPVSVAERIYRKPFRSSAGEQAGGKR